MQNQLVDLVHNADAKRLEIEKLQKELRQLKEKYYHSKKQEALLQKQTSPTADQLDGGGDELSKDGDENEVDEQLADCKIDAVKDLKAKDESAGEHKDDSGDKQDESKDDEDQKRPTSSLDPAFDSQPGPSGKQS